MREYKFRAWDKVHNEMIEWEQYKDEMVSNDFWDKDLVVMEWTGLTDKNGKDIYMGDLIEGGYKNPMTGKFFSKRYRVTLKWGSYVAEMVGKSPYGDTWLRFVEGKIIGNIFENKELLEDEN